MQEKRGRVELQLQAALKPLEEQLEGLLKAIITARGLKRRNIESEIQVPTGTLTQATATVVVRVVRPL